MNEIFSDLAKELLAVSISPYIAVYSVEALFYCRDLICNKTIKSNDELKKVVDEEADKLGLKDAIVIPRVTKGNKAIVYPIGFDLKSEKITDKEYNESEGVYKVHVITLGEKSATRTAVKHELYHIHKNFESMSKFKPLRMFQYFLYHEPVAILYSTIGIKI